MIARLAPSFPQLAAAIFPVAGCAVRGYVHAQGTRYNIELRPPQPWAGPASYHGTGANCYEALAQAVQVFHASAHAYPAAGPLAAAGSYSPPQEPQPFPSDDEPSTLASTASADEQPVTINCPKCNGAGCQHDVPPGQPVHGGDIYECYHCEGTGQVPATIDDTAEADEDEPEAEADAYDDEANACYRHEMALAYHHARQDHH
jgi:hypothetical protein